jgi:hypothetical protein
MSYESSLHEKDGAWKADAKIAGGVDDLDNSHPLNCTTDGTLKVDIAGNSFGPIDVIVDNVVPVISENSLVPEVFDSVIMSPTGTNPTTILYKTGGLSGTTVATLTLTYDGNNNIQTVVRT